MSTRKVTAWWLKLLGASFLSLAFAFASPALAQDEADEEAAADEQAEVEEIIVTGSRLKRSTYTSVSPLQVITAEVSREVGLIDPASILQESTAASGVQFDLSFNNWVLDNGPGHQGLSLRGLGSARTLVLVNGRRLAPSGVEGAPVAPDLSLVPSTLISQYDILLDGASSVYGSDAVAGVTNIILRKDFDGLELQAFSYMPEQTGGLEKTISAAWGKNFDRGFIGIGAEWSDSEGVRFNQRRWTADCNTHYEVDENGVLRSTDNRDAAYYGMRQSPCVRSDLSARIYTPTYFGSIYYTPGESNVGIPNFSESSCPDAPYGYACGTGSVNPDYEFVFVGVGNGWGLDLDQDGLPDVDFGDYGVNGQEREAHLFGEQERVSVMAYGEYTLEGERNITPFFEVTYSQKDFFADAGVYPIFPEVPAGNPYNPCNPDGVNGVDCFQAYNDFQNNPAYRPGLEEMLFGYYGAFLGFFPTYEAWADYFVDFWGHYESGATWVQPILYVDGDRTEFSTDIEQVRAVAGVRGDLPNWTFGEMANWSWELAAVYTTSSGFSRTPGIREDRLNLALGAYSTTNTPCENDTGEILPSDVAPGCVPVNFFAPSLYGVVGEFGTAAERNYVFDNRDFDTEYTQSLIGGFLTGDLFEMPSGPVAAGLGFEWRRDEIDSIPNAVAKDGLLFGFYRDGGAIGQKDTKEVFGEIEMPLLVNRPLAEELTLNLSARATKDEFYGTEWTYSGKVGYRPLPSLMLRATYGTSYRAPNLRENFLVELTGFSTTFDPCVVPAAADNRGTYVPSQDNRQPWVLQNCIDNGVDPTALFNSGFSSYSVEVAWQRGENLEEETSKSLSYGFVWQQPFFESFDMTVGATYYKIEIDNTLVHPSSSWIVNDCYNNPRFDSIWCEYIEREDGGTGLLDFIRRPVINRDNETVEGVDVNVALDKSVTLFGRSIDLGLDFAANRSLERSELYSNSQGQTSFDDDQGEWGFPDWKGQINLRAELGDWRFRWTTNIIGAVEPGIEYQTEFNDIWDSEDTGWYSETCLGPSNGDVFCRDKVDAGKYMLHSASVYYRADNWTVGAGVRNVFDEEPPRIDGYSTSYNIWSVSNTPIGYGYDLNGRTFFIDLQTRFD